MEWVVAPAPTGWRFDATPSGDYNSTGFEKIRHNRKWILILSMIAKGMKPKEISALTALKHETINSYIEQMIKETGCGNISEVLLQAGKRNIL